MRVDEGRNSWSLLAIKTKARAVVGRGEKSLLGVIGSALRLREEEEEINAKIIGGMSKNRTNDKKS